MRAKAAGAAAIAGALGMVESGCHKPRSYETEVELTRFSAVRTDEHGKTLSSDAEFSYTACPGEQLETIRGDVVFTACMSKHKIGDKLKVKLEHHFTDEGFWSWTVHEIGGCASPKDPDDESSFATIRDCAPDKDNGVVVGFRCDLKADKGLIDKCPWFRRR